MRSSSTRRLLNLRRSWLLGVAIFSLSCLALPQTALSQARARPQMISVDKEGGGRQQDFLFAMPVTLYGETVARMEFNLMGELSLGFEANFARRRDYVGKKEYEETGESLEVRQMGAAFLLTRYSEGPRMSGFYWALGAGYRQGYADWSVRPTGDRKPQDMTLLDDQERLSHALAMQGATGHIRLGYRFVPETVPVTIGGYAGVRHFAANIKDADEKQREKPRDVNYSVTTESEKESIKRRLADAPEVGIELGFVF